jgi:hypothetical protein
MVIGPAHYTVQHHFNPWLSLVVALGALIGELALVYGFACSVFLFFRNLPSIFGALLRKCGVGEKVPAAQAFLELSFPADTTKSAYATEQLHLLLPGLVKYYSLWDKLAARKKPYSLELVGTKDEGIRFILMIPSSEADIVLRTLVSFLPSLKV